MHSKTHVLRCSFPLTDRPRRRRVDHRLFLTFRRYKASVLRPFLPHRWRLSHAAESCQIQYALHSLLRRPLHFYCRVPSIVPMQVPPPPSHGLTPSLNFFPNRYTLLLTSSTVCHSALCLASSVVTSSSKIVAPRFANFSVIFS